MDNDTISRQKAIRWVKTECNPYGKPTLDFESGKKVIDHLERMPPVHSEQKHGRWIVTDVPNLTSTAQDVVIFTRQCRCSECGALFGRKSDKYCYNCGARMDMERE